MYRGITICFFFYNFIAAPGKISQTITLGFNDYLCVEKKFFFYVVIEVFAITVCGYFAKKNVLRYLIILCEKNENSTPVLTM